MTDATKTPGRREHRIPLRMNTQEKAWLRAVAVHYGVGLGDAARLLIHAEAQRRGWKEPVSA